MINEKEFGTSFLIGYNAAITGLLATRRNFVETSQRTPGHKEKWMAEGCGEAAIMLEKVAGETRDNAVARFVEARKESKESCEQ